MSSTVQHHPRRATPPTRWPGLALVLLIAGMAIALAQWPAAQAAGLGALTLAIVIGMALGNSVFPTLASRTGPGVNMAKGTLLRLGIVLYGFRVTFQDLAGVGLAGLAIDLVVVAAVFSMATWIGTRMLGLDRQTSMLIGAGSAICGAAAVLATEPVLRAPAHKVAVAVSTVVGSARWACSCIPGCTRTWGWMRMAMACMPAPPCTRWPRSWSLARRSGRTPPRRR